MADEIKDPNSITSDEMSAIIRGEVEDPRDKKPEPPAKEPTVKAEPEVIAEAEPTAPREPVQQELWSDDDRRKAVSTIDRLERENREFQQRLSAIERTAPQRREPEIELVEYLPGVRLPKDISRLPISLTANELKSIGLDADDGLAKALSILGSGLLMRMDAAMRPYIDSRYNELSTTRENASRGTAAFFDAYPDLAGHDDFIALVEQGARERDRIHEIYRGEDYTREVAKRVRTRIAAMRGESLADYESRLDGGTPTRRQPSRATVSAPRRGAAPPPSTGQQGEIDSLIDHQMGR